MRALRALAIAFALGTGGVACSLVAGVDWDRVAVKQGGGTLPDGAPIPPGDGSSGGPVPSGNCPSDQVECLSAMGVTCCPRQDDVGMPVSIAAGQSNTCAVTSTGHVRCWGANSASQLGRGQDPTLQKSNVPLTVLRIPSGAKAVTLGGSHACAIVGSLLACWGANSFGQLGTGGTDAAPLPVVVPVSASPNAVGAGAQTTCASLGGQGFCWGDNGGFQAGNEVDQHVLQPKLVSGLGAMASGSQTISAGGQYSCAASASGLACWGNNTSQRLGSNGVSMIGKATAVTNGAGAADGVTLGDSHACAIRGGALLCWGSNVFGQLGDDKVSFMSDGAVTPPNMTTGVSSVCAGFEHTCVVKDGAVWCAGQNDKGQTASQTGGSRVFLAVQGVSATQVACGAFHTCALFEGTIECWGANDSGQLGDGTNETSAPSPRVVMW